MNSIEKYIWTNWSSFLSHPDKDAEMWQDAKSRAASWYLCATSEILTDDRLSCYAPRDGVLGMLGIEFCSHIDSQDLKAAIDVYERIQARAKEMK